MTRIVNRTKTTLPPLYCYYGDDFTGSTDVLDCLASSGVNSVLFLQRPSPEMLRRFADCQAVGIAGDSRSRTAEEMDATLPEIFSWIKQLGAPVSHYKVCSTFDSSPDRGSIGRAMEIGRAIFAAPLLPLVVAAPHLGRYVAFGNLFAESEGTVFRIDRHPTMHCHPVTPMTEADLRLHLAKQTSLRVALLDLTKLRGKSAGQALESLLANGADAVLLDGDDPVTLNEAGRLVWHHANRQQLFAVGSSGLTSSLIPQWRAAGLLQAIETDAAYSERPGPVEVMLVMSGSCSPVTERQIQWALEQGYAGIRLDAEELTGSIDDADVMQAHIALAVDHLLAKRSVVMYSAMGPLESGSAVHGRELGAAVGSILREIVKRSGIRRAMIAGGDTSSHAVAQLGLQALTWAGPLEPGAPLCRAHAADDSLDGLELVLKGGQVGRQDFFERARLGTVPRPA